MTKQEVFGLMKEFQKSVDNLSKAWNELENETHSSEFTTDYPFELSFDDVSAAVDLWIESNKIPLQIKGFTEEQTGGNCTALSFITGIKEFLVTAIDKPTIPFEYPVQIGIYINSVYEGGCVCHNEEEVLKVVEARAWCGTQSAGL